MTNLALLKKYISDSGLSQEELADVCRITKSRLQSLLSGKSEFKASEMIAISRALDMSGEESECIFFDQDS